MTEFFMTRITRRELCKTLGRLGIQLSLCSTLFSWFTTTAVAGKEERKLKESTSRNSAFEPAYLKLHQTGELKQRAEELWKIMEQCRLCPRGCGVNRLKGMRGFCQSPGATLVISAFHPHFGEERPLVGKGGSGTIFLTHCNLKCVFCQNWEISHLGRGTETSIDQFAEMMIRLQKNWMS